jgi:hypothetical protein
MSGPSINIKRNGTVAIKFATNSQQPANNSVPPWKQQKIDMHTRAAARSTALADFHTKNTKYHNDMVAYYSKSQRPVAPQRPIV